MICAGIFPSFHRTQSYSLEQFVTTWTHSKSSQTLSCGKLLQRYWSFDAALDKIINSNYYSKKVDLKSEIPSLEFKLADGGGNFSVGQR
jgi:hypothetical protein